MLVGFTGTQDGMTQIQKEELKKALKQILDSTGIEQFHHGCCEGADEEAHEIVMELDKENALFANNPINIYGHPSILRKKDKPFIGYAKVYLPKDPLKRNKDIVNEIEMLIATPKEDHEVLRSGTWSTIRCARKGKKPITIIYPNGKIEFTKKG